MIPQYVGPGYGPGFGVAQPQMHSYGYMQPTQQMQYRPMISYQYVGTHMVPAGMSYPTYGAGYVGVPARSYVPSVALPRHHLAPPAPPPRRHPAPPPGPPPVQSTAVAPSKATTECKQGPAAAAAPVQSGSQQQDGQAGISREASAASSSGANIACTDSSDAGSSAGDADSPFAASTASTPRSAAEPSLGSAGAAAAAAAAAGRCTPQHSAAGAVSQGGSCAAQQAEALGKGFQKDPTSINSSNGCSVASREKDAALMAVQAAAKPVGALQRNHQGRPAAAQQLQGSAVTPSAANTKAGSAAAAQHRAAATAATLAIPGHKTPSHVRLQAAQHKKQVQQEVPFSLRSIRLLPPPADAAAAKALQSEFQFRMFAHHSKYVLDLLQPAASAKLSCLIRLSPHDLTAILQQPQPEQLLDQVWDRHRSK